MKKKLLCLLLLLSIILIPTKAFAADKKYNTLDFKETLKDEEIEPVFEKYNPKSDAITIYLFRGRGCGYCRKFLNFLNSITDEYGEYFKLESYEVWNDTENNKLMNEVSSFIGQVASGVPYIIIGDKVFGGYSEDYDDGIKTAITDLYKTKASKRYDVFKEMNNASDDNVNSSELIRFIFILMALIVVSTIVIMTYTSIKFRELNMRIAELNDKPYRFNRDKK